jgi:hypothetical protein
VASRWGSSEPSEPSPALGKDPLMSWGLWVYPLLKLHLLLAELE